MENHSKAIFRILSVGKVQITTFIDMDRQNRQDKPLTKKLPEVYLWLYGGELAPVRLGVRPNYNIAGNLLFGKFYYLRWALLDLNRRPKDYESFALTAELRARAL